MIPREDIVAGILSTPIVTLLLEVEEVKPSPRSRALFELLAEAGAFQRKGDKYRRGRSPPEVTELSPISEAVAEIFQHIVFPYLVSGRKATRLSPELIRALYVYTSAYQIMRIEVTQELLKYGGLTLVAGWFPCGFSSELMSISGRDVVIVEEREDILTIEMDRLSLIPLAPSPTGQELAAASFYSFETTSLSGLDELANKYGKFDTAIVCSRGVDMEKIGKIADEVYFITIRDRAIDLFNQALVKGLGLTPPATDEKFLKKAEKKELGPLTIYVIGGAPTA